MATPHADALLASLRARNAATAGFARLIADYQVAVLGRRDLQVQKRRDREGVGARRGVPLIIPFHQPPLSLHFLSS